MGLVDVRALTVSEGAVRALLELGVAEVPAEVASAVDAAVAGDPVVRVGGLSADRIRAVLAVLATELAADGPVHVVGLDGPSRDALTRAARVVSVPLRADGDAVRLGADEGEPRVHVSLTEGEPTGARWVGPGEASAGAGPVGEAIAVDAGVVLATAVADVLCAADDGASFVLVRDVAELSTVRGALAAAGLDVVLLDAGEADRSGPGGRRRAVAAGVRGGGADVLLGLAAGARDVDGRGFARVVWVGPLTDGWRGRLGRCPRLVVIDVDLDVAATMEAGGVGGVALTPAVAPSPADARRVRRTRELATLTALPAVADPERAALVRALLETPAGEAVLTAAVAALLRAERARRAAVAALSGGFVGRTAGEGRGEPTVAVEAPAAAPAVAPPAEGGGKKKRRRRKRRKGGGRDGQAAATGAESDDGDAESDDAEADDPTDEGPVELDLSDLDAVLEVE